MKPFARIILASLALPLAAAPLSAESAEQTRDRLALAPLVTEAQNAFNAFARTIAPNYDYSSMDLCNLDDYTFGKDNVPENLRAYFEKGRAYVKALGALETGLSGFQGKYAPRLFSEKRPLRLAPRAPQTIGVEYDSRPLALLARLRAASVDVLTDKALAARIAALRSWDASERLVLGNRMIEPFEGPRPEVSAGITAPDDVLLPPSERGTLLEYLAYWTCDAYTRHLAERQKAARAQEALRLQEELRREEFKKRAEAIGKAVEEIVKDLK